MNRKFLIASISAVLVLIVVVLALALGTPNASTPTEAKIGVTVDDIQSTESSEKEAAEKLIGKKVSREQVKADVGEWNKFEMSNKGCERGVYAGNFYYKDFMIFSRTYDKGKTFHIISAN